jgi:hypothetical protein
MRQHGRYGGFAVRADDADRVIVPPCQQSEQLCAVFCEDFMEARGFELGVRVGNRRRINHQVRAPDVCAVVPEVYFNAHFTHSVKRHGLVIVRAADVITLCVQNLHQRIHSAAADAYEVNVFFAFKKICHNVSLSFYFSSTFMNISKRCVKTKIIKHRKVKGQVKKWKLMIFA